MSAIGNWKVVVQSPLGAQESVLTLQQDGATLTGTQTGEKIGSVEIQNGKIEGDTINWSLRVKLPMPMTLNHVAKIEGDTLTGSVKAGILGTFPLSGTRA